MQKTKIEWVKNLDGSQGYTWNPITGCLNGCPYCYARKLTNGRLRKIYLANRITAPECRLDNLFADSHIRFADPFYPRFWDDKCYEIVPQGKDKIKPHGVFVCDMSDLFGKGVPERWTSDVLDSIRRRPDWRFYLLTKQPQNLIKWGPFPDNCWVGVSATDTMKFQSGTAYLHTVNAPVKFISFEPLLDWQMGADCMAEYLKERGINWIIIGQQTPVKASTQPKIEWIQEIVEAADKVGLPVFLKYNLVEYIPVEEPFYKNDGTGWRIRQEFPTVEVK